MLNQVIEVLKEWEGSRECPHKVWLYMDDCGFVTDSKYLEMKRDQEHKLTAEHVPSTVTMTYWNMCRSSKHHLI